MHGHAARGGTGLGGLSGMVLEPSTVDISGRTDMSGAAVSERKIFGPNLRAGLRPAPLKRPLHTYSQVPPPHTIPSGHREGCQCDQHTHPTPNILLSLIPPPHLFAITPPHLFLGAVRVLDARAAFLTPPHTIPSGAVRVVDARGVPVGPFGCKASIVELAWPDSDMIVDLPNAEQHRWVLVCRARIKHVPILSTVYAARLLSRCA